MFNYIIPALLNGILFFILSSKALDNKKENGGILVYGILILTIYLSINSNMFQSIMISSLAGANLLLSAITGGAYTEANLKYGWKSIVIKIVYGCLS